MQTKFLSALCSLALVFSLASCKDDKPSTGPDKPEPNENALAAPVPTIKYQDFNSVEIVWDAVANADSYEYFLVGGGRQETKERIAVYEDLKAGDYTIRVKAIPAEGSEYTESIWGDIAVSITIPEIQPITLDEFVGTWTATSRETLQTTVINIGADNEQLDHKFSRNPLSVELNIEKTTLGAVVPADYQPEGTADIPVVSITGWDPVFGDEVTFGLIAKDTMFIYAGFPTKEPRQNGNYLWADAWTPYIYVIEQEQESLVTIGPLMEVYKVIKIDGQYHAEPGIIPLQGNATGKVRALISYLWAFDPSTKDVLGTGYYLPSNEGLYPMTRMAGKISLTKGGAGASALPAVKKADYAFGALSYNKNYVMAR